MKSTEEVSARVTERARGAREAGRILAALPGQIRDRALSSIADALHRNGDRISAANEADCALAERDGLALPLRKRLRFDAPKRDEAVRSVRSVADLPDPVGRVLERRELDTGLILTRRTTPIGVVAMIFESRPDALVQIASLALKSGNAVVLKGGSEAMESNRILASTIHDAACREGVPPGWLQLLETREDVGALLELDQYIDLVIPRGSNDFVRHIMDNTRIPVMGHADGVCHLYLDQAADTAMAVAVAVDSKTQYVAVCNAVETLLVHSAVAPELLPALGEALLEKGVLLKGCPRTREILPWAEDARESDWAAEYLDLVLAIRVVDSLAEAIAHINRWGSGHTDAIVTSDSEAADTFLTQVDSASVMWNSSTRFADGFRYGLGAEVGISTSRLHARGPVGVAGLLSYKWILSGAGHVVADYASGSRSFSHRDLPLET